MRDLKQLLAIFTMLFVLKQGSRSLWSCETEVHIFMGKTE